MQSKSPSIRIFSSGIRKIPHLSGLLGGAEVLSPGMQGREDWVAVWGAEKRSGKRATEYAKTRGVPLLYLEEALYKGYAPKDAPLGLIKTQGSAYYDARSSHELSDYLNQGEESLDAMRLQYAQECIEMIRKYGLTKYNNAPPLEHCASLKTFLMHQGKSILLIDQTFEDKSVTLGNAGAEDFEAMYKKARLLYPHQKVLFKVHPLVASGDRRGYLRDLYDRLPAEEREHIRLVEEHVNVSSLFPWIQEVFVVTSQAGFDALLWGMPVRCFGQPFYGGWGLTFDEKAWSEHLRQRKVSIEKLFWGIAIECSSYVHPDTGERQELLEVLEFLSLQCRHHTIAPKEKVVFYNVRRWKRRTLEAFLGIEKNQSVHVWGIKRLEWLLQSGWRGAGEKCSIVVWGSKSLKELSGYRKECSILCVEDGFLRSVGLGADFVEPLSLAVDQEGIYFDPRTGSALEQILQTERWCGYEKRRAFLLLEILKNKALTKYNVGNRSSVQEYLKNLGIATSCILVAGQVEDDASIVLGAESIKKNIELLCTVIEKTSSGVILYKPHPDVVVAGRPGALTSEEWKHAEKLCQQKGLVLCNMEGFDIAQCYAVSKELHVITSTAGLEALVHGLTVFTYGRAFYAGYGLTVDMQSFERRPRRALWELMGACYMFYSRYRLPKKNHFTNVFGVINYIALQKSSVGESSPVHKKSSMKKNSKLKRMVSFCIRSLQGFI